MKTAEKLFTLAAVTLTLLASGCAENTTIPPGQPMTALPQRPIVQPTNGAIFQAGTRTLFEDRRARYVGDTLVVQIAEKTQASKGSSSSASRGADANLSVPLYTGLPGKTIIPNIGLTAKSGTDFKGQGESSSNNVFTGTMAATVIEVLPNGNLKVAGEKQVAINQGTEVIRVTGVVNPDFISGDNTVLSTQIADAHIEYTGKGYIDEAQRMGWLQRFFMSILPL
jgi:flagellar L-ring protein FlgH